MKLVEIKKLDLLTNSLIISKGIKRDHDTIIKLIDRNKEDLEEFGHLGFEIRAGYNNSKIRVALLNEQQTTLLITYMRNNDVVRAFKKKLVSEFFKMRAEIESKKLERSIAKLEYRPMTDAIKKLKEDEGKEPKHYHFSNEADMINRVVLGKSAAKFKSEHNIDKKEPLRDYLTPDQIKSITELQRANTVFIHVMNWDYEQRKNALIAAYQNNQKLTSKLSLN